MNSCNRCGKPLKNGKFCNARDCRNAKLRAYYHQSYGRFKCLGCGAPIGYQRGRKAVFCCRKCHVLSGELGKLLRALESAP